VARFAGAQQRAGFTGLVTRHAEAVRHLITSAPDHTSVRAELAPVGRVGGQDAVLGVKQDMRLGQAFHKGHEFGQGFHGALFSDEAHAYCMPNCKYNCHIWHKDAPLLSVVVEEMCQ
jgi:hypothetical protein